MFNLIFSKDIFADLTETHTFAVIMTGMICGTVIAVASAICHFDTEQLEHPEVIDQRDSADSDQESEEVPE